jgi:Zn-dependent protease with chaperone function
MRIAVYCPLLCALLFAAVGPRLAIRYLPPVAGMWTLSLGAGLSALATTWSLVLLAGTLVDELLPDVTGQPAASHDPVSDLVALTAVVLLVVTGGRLVSGVLSRLRMHRELRESCAVSRGPVVVLADPVPRAFAVPGGLRGERAGPHRDHGHVVVSQGMLAALTAAERRVLFAHERAHLRGGHHLHSGLVAAAAALNPLLIPVRGASVHLCERSADESAAAEVGDRGLAASSLARAALAAAAGPCASPALSYHHSGVGARVVALQRSPARGRPSLVAALLGVAAVAMVADIEATHDFLSLILGAVRH